MIDNETTKLVKEVADLVAYRDKLRAAAQNVAHSTLAFQLRTLDKGDQQITRVFDGLCQNPQGPPNGVVSRRLHKEMSEALYRVSEAVERLAQDRLEKLLDKEGA